MKRKISVLLGCSTKEIPNKYGIVSCSGIYRRSRVSGGWRRGRGRYRTVHVLYHVHTVPVESGLSSSSSSSFSVSSWLSLKVPCRVLNM
jgi:hypothetical protein